MQRRLRQHIEQMGVDNEQATRATRAALMQHTLCCIARMNKQHDRPPLRTCRERIAYSSFLNDGGHEHKESVIHPSGSKMLLRTARRNKTSCRNVDEQPEEPLISMRRTAASKQA